MLGSLRAVVVEGRAGGLLREPPPTGLAAAETVVAGRDPVESRGAAGLVTGLVGGMVFVLRVEASSASAVARSEEGRLSMMVTTTTTAGKV